jgi:hypothetical protein
MQSQIIRTLRGSPITVLVAFYTLERDGQTPITARLLKQVTGYGDHTVTDAIALLETPDFQMITRARGGWRLAQASQLILPMPELENREKREYREKRDLLPSSSSSNRKDLELLVEEEEENREKREYREKRDFQQCLKLLHSHGVGEPKASRLAELHHVTPDFITSHFTAIADSSLSLGTAIYRIEHNWNPALLPSAPPAKRSPTDEGRRYSEGEFSEFIQS